jgi:hypothetical protein
MTSASTSAGATAVGIPASKASFQGVFNQIGQIDVGLSSSAQTWLASLKAGPVDANWVLFNFIPGIMNAMSAMLAQSNAIGSANYQALNAYVADQVPGYASSPTTIAISSGTYNSSTGAVSLVLASAHNLSPGYFFSLGGLTGTGAFANLDGTFVATAGTAGTTLNFTAATGLAATTITGGTATVAPFYTNDSANVYLAAQACITWWFNNFPVDSGGFIQAFTMSSAGVLTPNSFSSTFTAGLQSLLQTLINSIS